MGYYSDYARSLSEGEIDLDFLIPPKWYEYIWLIPLGIFCNIFIFPFIRLYQWNKYRKR